MMSLYDNKKIAQLSSSKLLFLVVCLGFFLAVFLLNYLTPLIADDYSYALIPDAQTSAFHQIVEAQIQQWKGWGGRVIAHGLAQMFLMAPPVIFDIVNSFMFLALVLLIYVHIVGAERNRNTLLLIAVFLWLWFSLPNWGQDMVWLIGSANYLWPMVFALIFLLPYRLHFYDGVQISAWTAPLLFVAGILAGWSHENTSATLFLAFLGYGIYSVRSKHKIPVWGIAGMCGLFLGFIMLVGAPGNYVRLDAAQNTLPLVVRIAEQGFRTIYALLRSHTIFVVIPLISAFVQKKKIEEHPYILYALLAVSCCIVMLVSPEFPARAYLSSVVFAAIALGSIVRTTHLWKSPLLCAVVMCVSLIALSSYYVALKDTVHTHTVWMRREQQLIDGRDRKIPVVLLDAPIVTTSGHAAQTGLKDIDDKPASWPNEAIADYYGVSAVAGSYVSTY